ncbi:MAG: hypothetical protein IEMM0002_0232 [bacterium]|nr:MAG: hypothetical protein IEMM0002_0232 [bacterium]
MKDEKGFTLIEILISLAIISIAFTTLLSAFNRAIAAASESVIMTNAVMLADGKIALVGERALPEPGQSDWKTDERYPNYDYRTIVAETPFPSARLISVTVNFNDREIFTLESYVIK